MSNLLSEVCQKFCNVLEKHCKYVVVSGFLIISLGRSRGTEDIDIIMEKIPFEKFKELHNDLLKNKFGCLQSEKAEEIYEYLKNNLSVRYIYDKKFLPQIEIKMAMDELDEYQIRTRRKIKSTGVDVYFNSIECNIAFKEELLKSKRDLEDARFLRILYEGKIDEDEVEKIKKMIRELRL